MGPLTRKQQQLVQTEIIRIEQWIPRHFRMTGRPPKDRAAMARAFVAKAVYDMPTTRVLLDRLDTDAALRRLCGWEKKSAVPSESVFSRAFAEFAHTQLPQRVHEALNRQHAPRPVGGSPLPRLDGHRGGTSKEAGDETVRRWDERRSLGTNRIASPSSRPSGPYRR